MNVDLKESFSRIKPVCDIVMVCPTNESIFNFVSRVADLRPEVVQELQQYLLFPFITHIKSTEMEKKFELQRRLVDGMRVVLEKVTINSFEMCMKIETSLLQLVFDNSRPGMIADVPEELKHSVMTCLTVLVLNLDRRFREKLLKSHVPLLAQAIFVAVHIAKLDKLKALRMAAINCVLAHTVTHPHLMNEHHRIPDAALELAAVDMLSSILPGVLAALQDVATCASNPPHAIVVASLEAIHRILCLTMTDRFLLKKPYVTAADFAKEIKMQAQTKKEVSCKESKRGADAKETLKEMSKRSPEWYRMAGEKLSYVTKSVITLCTHDHFKVRQELAVYCARVLNECTLTMQPSLPMCLDILICLMKDEYQSVSEYSTGAVNSYFAAAGVESRHRTIDNLCENFMQLLNTLPRVLNNIDENRKLSTLNMVHGYVSVMCDEARPQRMSRALAADEHMRALCGTLADAVSLQTDFALLTQHAAREITLAPPTVNNAPWRKLQYTDSPACYRRLQEVCTLLGGAECADLILDRLLRLFREGRSSELVFVINWMCSAPTSSDEFLTRVLQTYVQEDVWYLPLEVCDAEPTTEGEFSEWIKDSVPGLFEGTVETRYTGISYQQPRVAPLHAPDVCGSLAEAQRNMVQVCLLTEGVGIIAGRMRDRFQRHLLKTLCLVLERVGSKFELLHQAGAGALWAMAAAGGHQTIGALVAHNADYFTHQVTLRLKKTWSIESALEILSVVMEYSDSSILDCLYGIVKDVLVQSCDKYYEKNLNAYLQVFLIFIERLAVWFPHEEYEKKLQSLKTEPELKLDLTAELHEYIKSKEEIERLMSNEQFASEMGQSVEEMYQEDMKGREEDIMDYDDTVAQEKPPLPQHATACAAVLRRCVHFVGRARAPAALAARALARGLPALAPYPDELLPLLHAVWQPLQPRFELTDLVMLRHAVKLLETMVVLSDDFLYQRCVKGAMPVLYKFLQTSSADSRLKDAGSVYRTSAAYQLQLAILESLPNLVLGLRLQGDTLVLAMDSADEYLSKQQPKPLQTLAIDFYKRMAKYDYGATWHHFRMYSDVVLEPPATVLPLNPVEGGPDPNPRIHSNSNIKIIFSIM